MRQDPSSGLRSILLELACWIDVCSFQPGAPGKKCKPLHMRTERMSTHRSGQISAIIRRLHRIDVGSFEHYRQDIISKLGRRDKVDGRARPKALYKVTFSTLRSWLTAPPEEESILPDRYAGGLSNTTLDAEQVKYSNTFWHIRKEVDKWQNRPHYWHIFGLMVFIVQ